MLVGAGLRLSPFPALPFSGNGVALLSLMRSTDRLRRGIDDRLGWERTDFLFSLLNSVTQAAAQRPMSSMVDGLHKYSLLREFQSRHETWTTREVELCKSSGRAVVGDETKPARPCPLPPGPIEEYAERAWAVSLAGFGLSFVTTRSFQRAVAALFGGLPRPARIGREVFASQVSRQLGGRGVLVRDPEMLRRLDRLDCLVIQGDLVAGDRFVLGGLFAEDPEEAPAARARIRAMFDSERPLQAAVDGLWVLRPWNTSRASIDIQLQEMGRERLSQGGLVISLERADRVVALAEVEIDHCTISSGSDTKRPPRTVPPITMPALISTKFLMMYCPSSVGA
jgi:cation-transporting ATPase I